MRVMILANNDVGLYQFRKELIEALLMSNEVIISLPYGELVDPLVHMGCRFIETSIDRRGINPIKDLQLFKKYQKIIKKTKPDIVLTYTIKPNVYGGFVCRIKKIPYAVNITGLGSAFENEGILKKLVIMMNKMACKNANVVFFENEENCRIFVREKIIKEEQAYTLRGAGVNLDRYSVSEYPKGAKIRFLYMGRVMAEKGIDELFGAMKKLIQDGIECELEMLGEYEENYKETIEQCEEEGWLHYYGYQKDVRPYIERCHCFVLPSWHEGMANTNLECAASGRPVITTNIPGCREAVIDCESGFLVKKRDLEDLYCKMKQFTQLRYEDRKKMGLKGWEHMQNVFDRKKVIKQTVDILKIKMML